MFAVFTLHCPSCRAVLQIRKQELLGQIIACPQCGSMVHITDTDTAADTELELTVEFAAANEQETNSDPFAEPSDEGDEEYVDKDGGENDENSDNEEEKRNTKSAVVSTSILTKFLTETGFRVSVILSLIGTILLLLLIYIQLPAPEETVQVPVDTDTATSTGNITAEDSPTDSPYNGMTLLTIRDPQPDLVVERSQFTDEAENENEEETIHSQVNDTTTDDTNPRSSLFTPTTPPATPDPTPPSIPDLPTPAPAKIIPRTTQFLEDQLKIPLPDVRVENTPLPVAVAQLSQVMNVPITFQSDILRIRPFTLDEHSAKVNIASGPTTTGDVLKTILEPYDVVFVLDTGQIRITASELEQPVIREVQYDIADLLAANWTKERLSEMLTRLVSPQSWQENGGAATFQYKESILVVQQTLLEQDTIDRLLEQLRILRNLPQKTARSEAALVPEVFGWDTVSKPFTLQYLSPTPLPKCLADITRKTGVQILVNHKTLAEEGIRIDNLRSSIVADKWPLDGILSELLGNVDLTYCILGERTVEVTTWSDATAPNRMTIELHPLSTHTEHTESPQESQEVEIRDRVFAMKQGVSPQTWRDMARPETLGAGDVVFDSVSGYMVVRQSQPIQRALRKWTNRNSTTN